MPESHDSYAALRYRDYRCLLAGNVLAALSVEMQAVAIGWELYQRTSSPMSLGIAGLAQFLPVLFLALPAGQAADRYSRKYLLMAAHGTMVLSSLGLAILSYVQGHIVFVYLLLGLSGCSRALGMPARSSLIALLVPRETLGNAVAWNSSGWQIANVVGPALGGLVIALTQSETFISSVSWLCLWTCGLQMGMQSLPMVGPHLLILAGKPAIVYLLTALCLLSCMGLIASISPRRIEPSLEKRSWSSLLAGIRFVRHTELLLAAITLDLLAVLLGGATALLPIYARDILNVGPAGFGWLRAAPAIGALFMALTMAHRAPLRRPGLTLLVSVACFGFATIVFGLSENVSLSFVMLALTGAFDNVSVVVRGTLMQILTPESMRGRVSAVNAVFISSTNELGAFESGITAEWFGPMASVVGGGVGTIGVVFIVMLYWPALVQLGPLHMIPNNKE